MKNMKKVLSGALLVAMLATSAGVSSCFAAGNADKGTSVRLGSKDSSIPDLNLEPYESSNSDLDYSFTSDLEINDPIDEVNILEAKPVKTKDSKATPVKTKDSKATPVKTKDSKATPVKTKDSKATPVKTKAPSKLKRNLLIAGGVVGTAAVGALAYKYLGEKCSPAVCLTMKKVCEAKEKVDINLSKLGNTMATAATVSRDKAISMKNTAANIAKATPRKVMTVASVSKDKAISIKNTVANIAKDKAISMKGTAVNAASAVKDKTISIKNTVANITKATPRKVMTVASAAKDKAISMKDTAVNAASAAVDYVSEKKDVALNYLIGKLGIGAYGMDTDKTIKNIEEEQEPNNSEEPFTLNYKSLIVPGVLAGATLGMSAVTSLSSKGIAKATKATNNFITKRPKLFRNGLIIAGTSAAAGYSFYKGYITLNDIKNVSEQTINIAKVTGVGIKDTAKFVYESGKFVASCAKFGWKHKKPIVVGTGAGIIGKKVLNITDKAVVKGRNAVKSTKRTINTIRHPWESFKNYIKGPKSKSEKKREEKNEFAKILAKGIAEGLRLKGV